MLSYTVNPEIFGVKKFSDTAKYSKIKNTKILYNKIFKQRIIYYGDE